MKSEYIKEMVNGWAAAFNVPLYFVNGKDKTPNPQIIIIANWLENNFESVNILQSVFKCVLENFTPTSTVTFPTIANIRGMWSQYNVIVAPEEYDAHRETYGNVKPGLIDTEVIQESRPEIFHSGVDATLEEIHRDNLIYDAEKMFKKYGFQKYLNYHLTRTEAMRDEAEKINPAKYRRGE